MQLPMQGKFDEAPGWALRPAWGQQYGRSGSGGSRPEWGWQYGRSSTAMALRPASAMARQNRNPQWGRQRMPEVRAFLRGLHGAIPSIYSEPGYAEASVNPEYYVTQFFPAYSAKYWDQSKQYADGVIAALQGMGYELRNLYLACATRDCFPAQYSFVMVKDGRQMEASAGNPIRFSSPDEEARYLDSLFSGSSSGGYVGGPLSYSMSGVWDLVNSAQLLDVWVGPVHPQRTDMYCAALYVRALIPVGLVAQQVEQVSIGLRVRNLETGRYVLGGENYVSWLYIQHPDPNHRFASLPASYEGEGQLYEFTPQQAGTYSVEVYAGSRFLEGEGKLLGSRTISVSCQSASTTQQPVQQTQQTYRRDVQLLAPDGYRAGGRFTLKVWGRPGQAVEIAAWQNSLSHGRTAYGTTDSSGYFEISGTWGAEHAGRWQEDVFVGGELVGKLDFQIAAPQQQQQPDTVVVIPPANQPAQPGSDSGTPGGGTGSETGSDTGGGADSGSGGAAPAGFSLSPTVLLLGAAALVFILGGRK